MTRPAVPLAGWVLAVVLAIAVAVDGAIRLTQDAAVVPAATSPPMTLLAGATGTTSVSGGTSATTTHSGSITVTVVPPYPAQEVLKVHRVTGSWTVRAQVVSVTGAAALDVFTIREVLGGASADQQTYTAATGLLTGSPTPLSLSGATDLSFQVVGAKASAGTTVLAIRILLAPAVGTVPTLTYNYTLSLTP